MFDKDLRGAQITALLALASAIEIIFCVALLIQEVLLRIPNPPCDPQLRNMAHQHPQGGHDPYSLVGAACPQPSGNDWHGWPSWENVYSSYIFEHDNAALFESGNMTHRDGQRGSAIPNCRLMSFIFQFCWSASDSAYFMITVDLLLNMFTSPFGSTRRRWYFYGAYIFIVALLLSVLLVISGDWGVSDASLLEDFCWNVNFGHHSLVGDDGGLKKSNWPWLQWLVYGSTVTYYVISFVVAIDSP